MAVKPIYNVPVPKGQTWKTVIQIEHNGTSWPARPTTSTAVAVNWYGALGLPLPSDWQPGDQRLKF